MQLRIAGLSLDTVNADLMPLFSAVGIVESITVIRDITSGKSKGYAIVKISDNQAGQEAINKLNGSFIKGSSITISQMPETMPGEMEFLEWLADNANMVLREVGLKAGHTVLDFGCGSGIFTIPAAEIVGENGAVIGVDVRPIPLERIREKVMNAGLNNVRAVLVENWNLSTGLPNESIDVILVFDMLHGVTARKRLFLESHRVLKPNGFMSIFPMYLGTVKLLDIVAKSRLFSLKDIISAPRYPSPSEVVNLVKLQRQARDVKALG